MGIVFNFSFCIFNFYKEGGNSFLDSQEKISRSY